MSLARQFLSKNKHATIVFKAILNNTNFNGRGFEDWNGGLIPTGLLNRDAQFLSNSETLISNRRVFLGGNIRDSILNGLSLTKSIGAPLDVDNIFDVGNIRVGYRNDELSNFSLQFREFEGASFEVLVGGLSNEGRVDEEELPLSDYLFFLSGKTPNHTYDHDEIFLPLNTIPNELENEWPLQTYAGTGGTEGDDQNEGRAKPFCIGECKNITPIELTDGLYQFHQVTTSSDISQAIGQIFQGGQFIAVNEAYENGAALTIVDDDPLTTTANIGEVIADGSGFIRAHVDVENLTLNVTGVLGGANEALQHIVEVGTKNTVELLTSGQDWPISFYFTEQRPLIEYVQEIAYSLDYYIVHQDDGNLELKRRYNGEINDFNGNPNVTNSFSIVESDISDSSIEFLGVSERYSNYKIGYDKNWTVLDKDRIETVSLRRELSREFAYTQLNSTLPLSDGIKEKTRILETNLINKTDAENFARLVFRDSRKRKKFSMSLINHQWSLEVGSVGSIQHPLIGSGLFEISSVSDDTSSLETTILGYLL